jgi:hypothetical protein
MSAMLSVIRISATILVIGALSGCAVTPALQDQLGYPNIAAPGDRVLDKLFRDTPFAEGPVSVVTTENGRLRSYLLVPCREGTMICAGGAHGHAAPLTSDPDFTIVAGAYRGREFRLSPGGDGLVITRTGRYPLAWE